MRKDVDCVPVQWRGRAAVPWRLPGSLTVRWRMSAESEDGQQPFVGAESCPAESGSDSGVADGAELADGETCRVAMFSGPCPVNRPGSNGDGMPRF